MDVSEFFTGTIFGVTPTWEVALRLLMAAAFAAVIGLDREKKDRPAGLRTHMLTAVAAAVFTMLTLELAAQFAAAEGKVGSVDPSRVIQAVTAGVAFLAAGSIIQSGDKVLGLTTGAGMWMAGALGVACGAGFYLIAGFATVLTFAILTLVHFLERRWLETKDDTE